MVPAEQSSTRLPSRRRVRGWWMVAPLLGAALTMVSCSTAGEPAVTIAPKPPSTSVPAAPTPTNTPTPDPVNPFTGEKPSSNGVLAVKIENTSAARPQAGLAQADLVVVEEVEGGITRLIGIYHSHLPARVGPVRSARNTDIRLLPALGSPGLVYSGANRLVQEQIAKSSLIAIERSDRDTSRPAPHNVFVDLASLAEQHKTGAARDIGLRFGGEESAVWDASTAQPTAEAQVGNDIFTFRHGSVGYQVRWRDKTYRENERDLTTANVIVLDVANRKDNLTTSSQSIVSETVGRGVATVYRDGRQLAGEWSRSSLNAGFTITTGGKPIPLQPGATWILLRGL